MSKKLDEHLKQKGFYFCAVSHDMKQCEDIIETLKDFQYWAYIKHAPDSELGKPHYHFLVHYNGGRSVQQIANKLNISGQFVQPVRKVVAFRRYMLHLDQPEKIRYSIDDVKTSDISSFKSAILGNVKKDPFLIFKDIDKLQQGKLTPYEFLEQNYIEISNLSFYQKIKIYELVKNSFNARLLDS